MPGKETFEFISQSPTAMALVIFMAVVISLGTLGAFTVRNRS